MSAARKVKPELCDLVVRGVRWVIYRDPAPGYVELRAGSCLRLYARWNGRQLTDHSLSDHTGRMLAEALVAAGVTE